jgi:hypothetical protein
MNKDQQWRRRIRCEGSWVIVLVNAEVGDVRAIGR